jgi:uncharacterized membrane protein (UPF0182 family)
MQPEEPLLKAYSEIFPDLFTPLDEMPATVRQHIRYPEDLFRLQTELYLRYHIRDARQFYRKEDQWDIPTELFGSAEQPVRPYYVIARIPGEEREEFLLILPFVPLNRTNSIAWLAAQSDGDNYGKLVSFRFPSSVSVPGPTQVERRIDADGRVSQQLTLWNQAGSTVFRGNLLMIPIGNANVFFEPLYLSATGASELPQLKRVVVVNGDSISMEPNLLRALDVVFGRAAPSGLDSSGAIDGLPTATPNVSGQRRPQRHRPLRFPLWRATLPRSLRKHWSRTIAPRRFFAKVTLPVTAQRSSARSKSSSAFSSSSEPPPQLRDFRASPNGTGVSGGAQP